MSLKRKTQNVLSSPTNRSRMFSAVNIRLQTQLQIKFEIVKKFKISWNLYGLFLTFIYLQCFVRTHSPKTAHTGISCSRVAFLTQTSPLLQQQQEQVCNKKLTSHQRTAFLCVGCAVPYFYDEGPQLMKFTTGCIHYENALISCIKVQWDIRVPLMTLIVILIWLTFLPSRLLSARSITKVLTSAISMEHTDFI